MEDAHQVLHYVKICQMEEENQKITSTIVSNVHKDQKDNAEIQKPISVMLITLNSLH